LPRGTTIIRTALSVATDLIRVFLYVLLIGAPLIGLALLIYLLSIVDRMHALPAPGSWLLAGAANIGLTSFVTDAFQSFAQYMVDDVATKLSGTTRSASPDPKIKDFTPTFEALFSASIGMGVIIAAGNVCRRSLDSLKAFGDQIRWMGSLYVPGLNEAQVEARMIRFNRLVRFSLAATQAFAYAGFTVVALVSAGALHLASWWPETQLNKDEWEGRLLAIFASPFEFFFLLMAVVLATLMSRFALFPWYYWSLVEGKTVELILWLRLDLVPVWIAYFLEWVAADFLDWVSAQAASAAQRVRRWAERFRKPAPPPSATTDVPSSSTESTSPPPPQQPNT
jgi:hypothetical protein